MPCFFLSETVRERCRGRLIDQAQDIQPGDAAGIFCGLPLRVVEVGGDGDDGVGLRELRKSARHCA